MTKQIIRLTESKLRKIIKETIYESLSEIGYRTAALAHGANYNAFQSKIYNHDINANSKMAASNNLRLNAITKAINGNFPNMILQFIEHDNANQYYPVVLTFNSFVTLNDTRFVIKGVLSVSGNKPKQGYIEYNFNTQTFYRVNYYGQGSVRRIYQLMIDNDTEEICKKFLVFVTNFIYSEKDYENNVDVNGSQMSKMHKT